MAHPFQASSSPSRLPLVLLVEDDPDTVVMYETFLNSSGYWVAAARTGEEACRAFDALQPDIVVTDLGLPGRSAGLQVIEHVNEHSGNRVPVIVVTGHERSTVPHTAAASVANILVKPVLPDELESEVRRTLDRSREARQRAQEPQRRSP